MALTNAERQARHRDKLKGTAGLSAAQIAQRDAVMAGPLLPLGPKGSGPTFLGLGRDGWRAAPVELVEHFGMREAWEGWRAEWAEHLKRAFAASDRAKQILMDTNSRTARRIMRERGALALCAAYDADPTFRAKRKTA